MSATVGWKSEIMGWMSVTVSWVSTSMGWKSVTIGWKSDSGVSVFGVRTYTPVDALRVVHDVAESLLHLVAVDLAERLVVPRLFLGDV